MKGLKKKIMGVVLAATMLFTGATVLADDSHSWDDVASGVSVTLSSSHKTETITFTAPASGSYTFTMSDINKTGTGRGNFTPRFQVNNSNWTTNLSYTTNIAKGSSVTIKVEKTNNSSFYGSLKVSGSYSAYPEFSGSANVTVNSSHAATMFTYTPASNGTLTLTVENIVSQRGLHPSVTFNGSNINNGPFDVQAGVEYIISAGGDHTGSYDLISSFEPSGEPAPAPSGDEPEVPFYTEEQLRSMSVQNFVEGLYLTVLGRQYDAEGRDSWMNNILEQNGTATSVAIGFLESPEFTSKNLSNEEFIATCYRVFCNRSASEAEMAPWIASLEAGTTRDSVIREFAQSAEWASICAFFMVNV